MVPMQNKIELLTLELLNDKKSLVEIDYWLRVFNWENGWHYDLDIIWILKKIKEMNLRRGSTIIDAGAGLGITQFVLASKGFNIISLDFTVRKQPKFSKGIFDIEIYNTDLGDYDHEYMKWMNYGENQQIANNNFIWHYLKKLAPNTLYDRTKNTRRTLFYLKKSITNKLNLFYELEKRKDHSSYGKIIFVRGTFNNIPLENNRADALVSISAFEHNTYKEMPGSILEFERVIKKESPMIITTSASDKDDWYFEPAKSWIFSVDTLSKWFDINVNGIKKNDILSSLVKIRESRELQHRMSPFYKYNKENGLPFGRLQDAQYIPVGILKFKR